MAELATLRLEGDGDLEVELLSSFLRDLNRAYASIFVFEHTLYRLQRDPYRFLIDDWEVRSSRPQRRLRSLPAALRVPSEEIELYLPRSQQLTLARVELASPGFWEFAGKLNPLEIIRKYLDDRHRRRQDREYRETAEARRLELENLQLENEVISDRIRIAKDLGYTDSDLAPIVRQLLERPLTKLAEFQDRGVIDGASVREAHKKE